MTALLTILGLKWQAKQEEGLNEQLKKAESAEEGNLLRMKQSNLGLWMITFAFHHEA